MALELTSSDFTHNGHIPPRFTCEGDDISPALEWTSPPAGTQAFVLILDDPDAPDPAAPQRTWVHWVLYDIPAGTRALPQGAGAANLPAGTRVGVNDWKRADYGGPCPPIGRHRYFFKLYALDRALGDLGQAAKAAIEQAMNGHELAQATLMGTYQKAAGGRG
jgi:Raf kinase inhibitor-like YbhB/YbcL family protein